MKKKESLFAALIIIAMLASAEVKAVEYDLQEVQGAKGTEIIISVTKSKDKKEVNQEQTEVQNTVNEGVIEPVVNQPKTKKEEVLSKYQIKNDKKVQTKAKTDVEKTDKQQVKQAVSSKAEETKTVVKQEKATEPQKVTPAKDKVTTAKTNKEDKQQTQETVTQKAKNQYYTDWSDDQAEKIVTDIGQGLQSANKLDMELKYIVVDEEEVNACTDIDNNIYVFSGILPYVENEDELAFIIAHEMGHAASKHVLKGVITDKAAGAANKAGKKAVQKNVAGVATQKLGSLPFGLGEKAGAVAQKAGEQAVDKTTTATTSALDRGREKDADLLAIDYLVKKGYNPLAGISIMTKIGDVYPDFFADHPSTDKRVVTMYNYVSKNYPKYISKGFDTEAYKKAKTDYLKK